MVEGSSCLLTAIRHIKHSMHLAGIRVYALTCRFKRLSTITEKTGIDQAIPWNNTLRKSPQVSLTRLDGKNMEEATHEAS